MLKILIVDDEKIVRDGIKFILEKKFNKEVNIIGMAKTGREAIEKCEETVPHIILMDIQMPGINGIEAIKTIKDINKKIKFIIVSAYEQFEYAKSAVELGVKDYILKPINRNKFIEVINRVIEEIETEKNLRKKEIENQEKLDKVLPMLEHGFIYSILLNSDFNKEALYYQELFDLGEELSYMMVIEFGEGLKPRKLKNKIGTGLKSQIQYPSVRDTVKYKCKSIVGPIIINRIPVLIYEEELLDEYQQRIKSIELAETIKNSLNNIISAQIFIGIGSCYTIEEMNVSYNEALKAISKISGEEVLHIKDVIKAVDTEKKKKLINLKNIQERIINKIEEGNDKEVEKLLKKIFTLINRYSQQTNSDNKNLIIELVVLIYSTAYRNNIMDYELQYDSYLDVVKSIDNNIVLQRWCIERAKLITQKIKLEKEANASNVIYEAKKYIDKHFNKDISLKEISQEVSISPQYFSRIFKEELGVTFIDYLTQVRIKHAKKMLKEKNKSIKEICFEIGYNDPNYFSRLFKKIEGVSPTEY